MKKGKFLSFLFPGREDSISGVVLNYNEEWVLIRRCFDYRADGYTVFRKSKGVSFVYGDYEKRATIILKKKFYKYSKDIKFEFIDIESCINKIAKKYSLLQLDTKDGKAYDVVKFLGRKDGLFVFRELTVACKWRFKLILPEIEINFISFDSDYLNSLKLIL